MAQRSVIAHHIPAAHEVLELREGDIVRVGDRDDQWPLWLWCTNDRGAGWIPEGFLDIHEKVGRAKRDYTTRELAVSEGDQVELVESHGGWAFVRPQAGEPGWVPEHCLKP